MGFFLQYHKIRSSYIEQNSRMNLREKEGKGKGIKRFKVR